MFGFTAFPPQHADYCEVTAFSGALREFVPPDGQYTSVHAGGVLVLHLRRARSYTSGGPQASNNPSLKLAVYSASATEAPASVVIWNAGETIARGGTGANGSVDFEAGTWYYCGGGGGGAGDPEGVGGDGVAPGADGATSSRPSGGAGGLGAIGGAGVEIPPVLTPSICDGGDAIYFAFVDSLFHSFTFPAGSRLIFVNGNGKLWAGGGGGGGGALFSELDGNAGGNCGVDGAANDFAQKGLAGVAVRGTSPASSIVYLSGNAASGALRGAVAG